MPYRPLGGTDWEWLGIDELDHLAAFTTAGSGPIPTAVAEVTLLRCIAPAIVKLPFISEFELFCDVPRPDDFIDFARRGLFSYDWGSEGESLYLLQARPLQPCRAASLPAHLIELAVRLPAVLFSEHTEVDPPSSVKCVSGEGD